MAQVLLVRHGQASWGQADYDVLSEVGHEQGRVLGRALAARGARPGLVVRGGLRRHAGTAEAVLAGAGWDVDVEVDRGWDEFDHQQVLDLHPADLADDEELTEERFSQWFHDAVRRWTGGDHDDEYDETFTAFCRRVEDALGRVVGRVREQGGTAVVPTSGGAVAWVAASLLGGGADLWARLNVVTANASVTKVVVGRRGPTLVSFNDHAHLEGEHAHLLTYR